MNFKIVTAAIVLQDNKVLLTRRAPGQSLEGYWEFPGGKVEEGESLQECLKREIFEELGVQVMLGNI
jgi:mutator protein MutT